MKKSKRKPVDGGKSIPCRGGMKLYEVRKMPGERKKRVSLSVFTTERPALSDGRTQNYTDYHRLVKHEVTSPCVGCKIEKKRKTEMPINHFYCHLNLSLHL